MSDTRLQAAKVYGLMLVSGLGIIATGAVVQYKNEPPLPPAPPPEAKPERAPLVEQMNTTKGGYLQLVQRDSRRYGAKTSVEELSHPFPYQSEFMGSRLLTGHEGMETEHLIVTSAIERAWTKRGDNQSIGFDHIILRIKNRTSNYLAYRVLTEVDEGRCANKAVIPQNAIALRPNEEITRTECMWSSGLAVNVRRIEVMEVPALSYFYLSRLYPSHVLYPERTSEGHHPPVGKLCELLPWRDIKDGADSGEFTWHDVVDFYARHTCDEYLFYRGYRQRKAGDPPLPAVAATSPAQGTQVAHTDAGVVPLGQGPAGN
jgi:hypothetical protein